MLRAGFSRLLPRPCSRWQGPGQRIRRTVHAPAAYNRSTVFFLFVDRSADGPGIPAICVSDIDFKRSFSRSNLFCLQKTHEGGFVHREQAGIK